MLPPISQTLALIVELTRHEQSMGPDSLLQAQAGDEQIIDNQAVCCDYRSHHQHSAHTEGCSGMLVAIKILLRVCFIARGQKNVLNPETEYNTRAGSDKVHTVPHRRVRH